MSDQVHMNQLAAERLEAFSRLLTPWQLRMTAPREVILQAMKFGRLEADFAKQYRADVSITHVSIFASDSSQHFAAILKLFLYGEGLRPSIATSHFDGITTHAFDPLSEAWSQVGDEVIILPAIRDIKEWPRLFAVEAELQAWAEKSAGAILAVWDHATKANPACRIYQAAFVEPLIRQLGNLELRYPFSRTRCIRQLNQFLLDHSPPNVCLVDMEYLSSLVGKTDWVDEAAYYSTKQPFAIRMMPLVAGFISRLLSARLGNIKKCLVLDLDNTIWGGVVGDDGVDGLRLSPSDPVGEAFLGFQEYVRSLKDRGIILAVCSKNDEAVAKEVFAKNPDMLLKQDDFAAFFANWDDKHDNLRRIAAELNLGLDSLVFFDDNPAERALVSQFLPDVWVVDVPADVSQFSRALQMSFAFEWPNLTLEDLGRAETYVKLKWTVSQNANPSDFAAYLRSLQMEASVARLSDNGSARFHQLINKTNQFNLRTVRYSESEIENLKSRSDYLLLDVRLKDVHINYGSISNVVLRVDEDDVFIENWVMSCRTFKRGVEDMVFEAIKKLARNLSKRFIVGEYRPTAKNGYVANLLPTLGLSPWCPADRLRYGDGDGQLFRAALDELGSRSHHIAVFEAL